MSEKQPFEDINSLIQDFNKSLNLQFPLIEAEIDEIISARSGDKANIESRLNTLLSLAKMGMAEKLFIKLLEYYKTIDPVQAGIYWTAYDEA